MAVRGTVSNISAARATATEKAIERARLVQWQLACGCWTDRDVQEIYRDFRPRKGVFWCERHSKWVKSA